MAAEILNALNVFLEPKQVTESSVVELNGPDYRRPYTVSGYFDNLEMLAASVAKIDEAAGKYFVPNLVNPALLERASKRVRSITDKKDGQVFVLGTCPWNPQYTDRNAYIIQFPNGASTAGLHHNGWRIASVLDSVHKKTVREIGLREGKEVKGDPLRYLVAPLASDSTPARPPSDGAQIESAPAAQSV